MHKRMHENVLRLPMNEDFAWTLVLTATKAGAALTGLVADLKAKCSAQEFEILSKAIARVRVDIGFNIISPIYQKFPELENRLDTVLETQGHL